MDERTARRICDNDRVTDEYLCHYCKGDECNSAIEYAPMNLLAFIPVAPMIIVLV